MAQIPPIEDNYIDDVIKSNKPHNPSLNRTQGNKMRELVKLLRDRLEQEISENYQSITIALENKVDKEAGKGLSQENFTSAFKSKLEELALMGVSSGPVDTIGAPITENSPRLFYNTTSYKLRVYNPVSGQWRDAIEADLANYYTKSEVDALLNAIPTPDYPVISVNGKIGTVMLNKADIGLGNVDNTNDLAKPVSTATQTALDSKVDKSTAITGSGGISVGGALSTGTVSIGVNDTYLNSKYLRKDVDDNNGNKTLTIGKIVSPSIEADALSLSSLGTGASTDQLLVIDGSGLVKKKSAASEVNIEVANSSGTNQFSLGATDAIRFSGSGDASVSFNPSTKTVTINSIPGSGTGGTVASFNGRTGSVSSEIGDYSTSQVTEGSNLYFSDARTRAAILTGFSLASTSPVDATDNVLQALGKLQGQTNTKAAVTRNLTVSGVAGRTIVSGGAQNLTADREWIIDMVASGVTAGTYPKVGVDSYGRVISGTSLTAADIPTLSYRPNTWVPAWGDVTGKPTTFAPSAHSLSNHSDVTITTPVTGQLLRYNGTAWVNWNPNFLTSFTETDPTVPAWAKTAKKPSYSTSEIVGLQAILDAKADKAVTITGTGYLTGGGNLAANRTLDLTTAAKADIAKGVTAESWGNHSGKYLALTGGTINGFLNVNRSGASVINMQGGDGTYGSSYVSFNNKIDGTSFGYIGKGSGSNRYLHFINTIGVNSITIRDDAAGIRFGTDGVERAYINSDGITTGGNVTALGGNSSQWNEAFSRYFPSVSALSHTKLISQLPDGQNINNFNTGMTYLGGAVVNSPGSGVLWSGVVNGGYGSQVHIAVNGALRSRGLSNGVWNNWRSFWSDADFTSTNVSNWNTAFGWGNHVGLYRPISWIPTWGEITSKPTTFTPSAHTHTTSDISTLTGYALGTNAAIATNDNLNTALGKLQAQINTKTSATGTVTSVALTAPTGLTVSGSPITGNGTLTLALQTGYAIPTNVNQSNWNTAFGWGNHAGLYRPISWAPTWGEITSKPTTFTPSAHTHNASDINVGILAPARIGTGTASASTVLYGDGTWKTLTVPTGFVDLTTAQTIGGIKTFNETVYSKKDIISYSTSDINLKTNISKIENAMGKINNLSGYNFTWKEDAARSGDDYGVIAQEVECVLPNAVITREDGYKAVDYQKLVPVLIEAIKELQKEVKELKDGRYSKY